MATTLKSQADAGAATDVVRFHLSLNVDDLARSVEFYRVLFDAEPAKLRSDYAKFELAEPPLVLSLEPNHAPRGGKLNHLGFRLQNSEILVEMQRRLESHGHSTSREEGVECCYARQTKFWIADPDANLWEMYTLEEDLEHRGMGKAPRVPTEVVNIGPAPAIWAHRLGEPMPATILAQAASVDEVVLEGTFNAALSAEVRRGFLDEVFRILKPGGQLSLHQLTARVSLPLLRERLPGPAAVVDAIPTAAEVIADLEAAGFAELHFSKLGDGPYFAADGVDCRETRLSAIKPAATETGRTQEVLYKGPAKSITDDAGNRFERGVWTVTSEESARRLRSGPLADHFAF